MARLITGLPKWTPLRLLLAEAGLPPLHLLLDYFSQRYRMRILCNKDQHPCKKPLLKLLLQKRERSNGAGLQTISDLLVEISPDPSKLQNTTDIKEKFLPPPQHRQLLQRRVRRQTQGMGTRIRSRNHPSLLCWLLGTIREHVVSLGLHQHQRRWRWPNTDV